MSGRNGLIYCPPGALHMNIGDMVGLQRRRIGVPSWASWGALSQRAGRREAGRWQQSLKATLSRDLL